MKCLQLRVIGILIGNIFWFISYAVLLYMFQEFGIDVLERTR